MTKSKISNIEFWSLNLCCFKIKEDVWIALSFLAFHSFTLLLLPGSQLGYQRRVGGVGTILTGRDSTSWPITTLFLVQVRWDDG
jgi:hypothetical protein